MVRAEIKRLAELRGTYHVDEDEEGSVEDSDGMDGALGDQLVFMQEGGEVEDQKVVEEGDKVETYLKCWRFERCSMYHQSVGSSSCNRCKQV